MAAKKGAIPVHVPGWTSYATQNIDDGAGVYCIAMVIVLAKELPVFEIPLEGMRIDYKLGTASIIDFVGHMRAVEDADMSKPIILDVDGWVIDGRHRIANAVYNGKTHISAVRFVEKPPYVRSSDD